MGELAWSTRWGDIHGCTLSHMQKQRLHHPRDTRGPMQHNLAGWTQASPVRLRILGRASGSATKQAGANCHRILSQIRPPLPLIPIVSAGRMPRTLHPSAICGWMCLAQAGGAVRVGAETHRSVGFFVGCVKSQCSMCAPQFMPVTTADTKLSHNWI